MPASPASPFRVGSRRLRGDRGAVTAETIAVLPVLVLVTLGLLWLVALGAAQVRVVDAARETARAVARSEPLPEAVSLGRRIAPDGARLDVSRRGGLVVVRVSVAVDGPAGVLRFLPPVTLDTEAVAAVEPS